MKTLLYVSAMVAVLVLFDVGTFEFLRLEMGQVADEIVTPALLTWEDIEVICYTSAYCPPKP